MLWVVTMYVVCHCPLLVHSLRHRRRTAARSSTGHCYVLTRSLRLRRHRRHRSTDTSRRRTPFVARGSHTTRLPAYFLVSLNSPHRPSNLQNIMSATNVVDGLSAQELFSTGEGLTYKYVHSNYLYWYIYMSDERVLALSFDWRVGEGRVWSAILHGTQQLDPSNTMYIIYNIRNTWS